MVKVYKDPFEKIILPLTFKGLLRLSPIATGFAIITAILSAGLSITPFCIIYFIAVELFKPHINISYIWQLASWAIFLLILRWALMAISHTLAHIGAFTIVYQLRRALAIKLGKVPMAFLGKHGSGSLRRTLNDDVGGLEGFYAHILPDLASAIVIPIIAFILLFLADWRLAIVTLIPLPIAFIAQSLMLRGMGDKMQQWGILQKSITNEATEYIRGIQVIKSFGLEARSFGNLAQTIQNAVNWISSFTKKTTGSWILFTSLLKGNIILVAPIGAILYSKSLLDLPTFLLFLLISPIILEPYLRLMHAMHERFHHIEALKRINTILSEKNISEGSQSGPIDQTLDIEFSHITHHYNGKIALDDISFCAKQGEITALVGASGSGKSTLIKLVARLYEFDEGQLTLGNRDIRQWPGDVLLNQMSIVFQDVALFSGSVLENLQMAKPSANKDEIKKAAIAAYADEFIMALPHPIQKTYFT